MERSDPVFETPAPPDEPPGAVDPPAGADEGMVRTFTVDEAVQLAIQLQRSDRLQEADGIYRGIFEVAPRHAEALHYAGVLAHQQGRSDDAVMLIEKSLAVAPDNADCYSNLGMILQEHGDIDRAVTSYRRAIELRPDHANAHSNLGVLLTATGKSSEAEAEFRTAIQLQPDHADAYENLGVLLKRVGRAREAVQCFCQVITLRPQYSNARHSLAQAYCTLGEVDKAVEIYEQWLVDRPDDAIARHMVAACTGRNIPPRASDEFIQTAFDVFASTFEERLARLSYRAPAIVASALADVGVPKTKSLDVLDAGCGTGLCGPLLAPYARRLTGVDLSSGMLEKAAGKKIYDELIRGELTAYLQSQRDAFDVIVSADTLVYFGPLEEALAAAAGALRPNGVLVFTLEAAAAPDAPDHALQTHGRYCHAQRYVERLLTGLGLAVHVGHAELRMESGMPVAGLVVRGVRRAGTPGSPAAKDETSGDRDGDPDA